MRSITYTLYIIVEKETLSEAVCKFLQRHHNILARVALHFEASAHVSNWSINGCKVFPRKLYRETTINIMFC